MPTSVYKLRIKFPRGNFEHSFGAIDEATRARMPAGGKNLAMLDVSLKAPAKIHGYGMPFANPGHESGAWIKRGEPMSGDKILVEILEQTEFRIVVAEYVDLLEKRWNESNLPPPIAYPYAEPHDWNLAEYKEKVN